MESGDATAGQISGLDDQVETLLHDLFNLGQTLHTVLSGFEDSTAANSLSPVQKKGYCSTEIRWREVLLLKQKRQKCLSDDN